MGSLLESRIVVVGGEDDTCQVVERVCVKGPLQREHLRQHDAVRPHVGRLCVCLPTHLLGRHVIGRATRGGRESVLVDVARETKVAQLDMRRRSEEDVLRLEVAVEHIGAVHDPQRASELRRPHQDQINGKIGRFGRAPQIDGVTERATGRVFRQDAEQLTLPSRATVPNDVLMVERREDIDLARNALELGPIGREAGHPDLLGDGELARRQ
mmetsp:Transcript_82454/g.247298  ORF Transcript_82454/g.247298 Transcript_82454/m.247298 type:complete len:212 (-) Transcript_82454:1301-1936(-)